VGCPEKTNGVDPIMKKIRGSRNYLTTDSLDDDLQRTTLRGGAVTASAQILKFFIQTASTMVLARLLTPQDFGLIAMASTVTGFVLIFKDLGLSMATIQRKEITHQQISNLFWINVVISIVLMVVTISISPLVSWFYKDQRLLLVTIIMSSGFIFEGGAVQHQALLRRQMKFKYVMIIEISSLFFGICIAILLSALGLNYWALVYMNIANSLFLMIGSWYFCRWIPGLPSKKSGIKIMVEFGKNLTVFNFVNFFARNLDTILIGKFWGTIPVGFYSKAYSLVMLPIGQITAPMTSVAIPALSKLQNDPVSFQRFYLKALRGIAYVSMPLIASIALLSDSIIELVYGQQWMPASKIFKILALSALIQPICSTVGWIYISSNNTKRMAQWSIRTFPILFFAFLIGVQWGATGVAIGYTAAIWILFYPIFSFACKGTPIKAVNVFTTIANPVILTLITSAAIMLIRQIIPINSALGSVVLSYLAAAALGAVAMVLWRNLRNDISEIISALKNALGSKR
jgi:O-antigen/teichoic acid export membrane protein